MLIKVIRGQQCTDRAGAAEVLDRSVATVKNLAAERATTGFPKPWHVDTTGRGMRTLPDGTKTGKEWYRLDHLTAFKTDYDAKVTEAGRARSHGATLDGDPAELLTPAAFAAYLGISDGAFMRYVDNSKDTWDAFWLLQHATITGNQAILGENRGGVDLTDTVHTTVAHYGGTWHPDLPGYVFPRDARTALATLLNGDDFFLPPPDKRRPANRGQHRRWRRDTAHTFTQTRRGSASSPGRPPIRPAAP